MAKKDKNLIDSIKEFLKTIFFALLIAGLIRTLFFQPFWIPSGSMKPNLLIGDYIFVNKFVYAIPNIHVHFRYVLSQEEFFIQNLREEM